MYHAGTLATTGGKVPVEASHAVGAPDEPLPQPIRSNAHCRGLKSKLVFVILGYYW